MIRNTAALFSYVTMIFIIMLRLCSRLFGNIL